MLYNETGRLSLSSFQVSADLMGISLDSQSFDLQKSVLSRIIVFFREKQLITYRVVGSNCGPLQPFSDTA